MKIFSNYLGVLNKKSPLDRGGRLWSLTFLRKAPQDTRVKGRRFAAKRLEYFICQKCFSTLSHPYG